MKPLTVMLVAGEASGDKLAAELVQALRPALVDHFARVTADFQPCQTGLAPLFFGAGGPQMAAAGVELIEDTTAQAVFGLSEVLRHLETFRRLLQRLVQLAAERQPDLIILVDSSGFNRRLAAALRARIRSRRGSFNNWSPRIVYYVSPQVWASRPGRARQMARDIDLLLAIFPFEPGWYARFVPQFHVVFVGHPLVDRYPPSLVAPRRPVPPASNLTEPDLPLVLLLPGSRKQELRRHLPPMLDALQVVRKKHPLRVRMVLPNASLQSLATQYTGSWPDLEIGIGGLAESLTEARIALASSGTVTLECALFNVPAVVIYRVSWPTYLVARQIVRVPFVAMPNLLANTAVYPEFIQGDVTAKNIAREALDLLSNEPRRDRIRQQLQQAILSLGPPGASQRAAQAILRVLTPGSTPS
jgi:lipid-A-disaccharide synthase